MSRAAAVVAVREIAERLARPPIRLDALAARALESPLLTQSLPLLDVTPFGVLGEAAVSSPDAPGGLEASARAEVLRPRAIRPSPPSGGEPGRTSRAAGPVFSFRRPGAAAASPAEPHRPAGSEPAAAGEARRDASPTRDREGGHPPSARPGAGAALDVSSTGSASGRPTSAPASRPAADSAALTIELVGTLATEILAMSRGERRTVDAMEPSAIRPATRAIMPFDPVPAPERRDPLNAAGLAAPPPASVLTPARGPESAWRLPELGPPAVSPGPSATAGTPGRAAGHTVTPLLAPSAGLSLDAETLAALVNDVLAEQARRHGVDLS